MILPPFWVYFTAFVIKLISTCLILPASPIKSVWTTSTVLNKSSWPFCSASGRVIELISVISSLRQNGSSVSSIFPFSIFDISRISLIRSSRWLLDMSIFVRHSLTFSGSLILDAAMEVMPMIAFIGVLISWDIWARKLLFASLAFLAASYAASSAFLFLSSCSFSSSTLWTARMTFTGIPFRLSANMIS